MCVFHVTTVSINIITWRRWENKQLWGIGETSKTEMLGQTDTCPSRSTSSFYWASVANAPNVLQPYWLIVLALDVPDLTTSLLLWGPSGHKWKCLWTFIFFPNVPTFATSRLQEILAAKVGTTWTRNGGWILPENARLSRNIQGSLTCRKPTTSDRRLYFPFEGSLRSGLNPRTWVPKASTLPLDHRSRLRDGLKTLSPNPNLPVLES